MAIKLLFLTAGKGWLKLLGLFAGRKGEKRANGVIGNFERELYLSKPRYGKFIIISLEIILIVYCCFIILPFFYKECKADITIIKREKTGTYTTQGKYGNINTRNYTLYSSDVLVKYEVYEVKYISQIFSKMIIYPNPTDYASDNIIYYNPLLPNDSVVFKGNIEYLIYNNIPLFFVLLLHGIILIKKKKMI